MQVVTKTLFLFILLTVFVTFSYAGSTNHKTAVQPETVTLFDNLGTLHHPITTSNSLAQQYFDQGLRLVYAFNHEEAIRAFEEAARIDPNAAMAYWGIAYALGPNINAPMDRAQERKAYEAIQKAKALSEKVKPPERAYIDALAARYSVAPNADRKRS